MTALPNQPPPLRRDRKDAVIAGVCAALGRRLGIDPLILRIAFAVASAAGGAGVLLYLLAWAAIPGDAPASWSRTRVPGSRESWQVAGGIGLLVLAGLLLFRQWGLWIGDGLVWPVVLASGGAALIWRQSAAAPVVREARDPPTLRMGGTAVGRAALGVALVIGAGLVFLDLNNALRPARDVLLAVIVVVIALTLILAPWWLRLARGFAEERGERIRSQERAELAAHLHDSVLQTLALMQRRAADPKEVAALARRQERELRAWLNDGGAAPGGPRTFATALQAAATEVEDAHGVPVDVVAVGDCALDAPAEAVLGAAREALVNAAKFAGEGPVSVYAEAGEERLEVFVRDRGPGFDPASVPGDRRGLRESILGRMRRHGGEAVVHTGTGDGTEVELTMERRA